MNALRVRPAEARDFDAVGALLQQLGRPAVTALNRVELEAIYRQHLGSMDTGSLVAEIGGRVVGFIALEFRQRLNQGAPQAWVPDFIVDAAVRGLGVGKALFRAALLAARERRCFSLALESGYARTNAHQFYLKQGMEDRGKYFVIGL